MAFANSNDFLDGRKPMPIPSGPEVVAVRMEIELATGDLALNDIGAIGFLPAGCIPVALYVDADDLDSGTPALVTSVGLLNAGETDLDVVWGSGLTVGQSASAAAVVSTTLLQQTSDPDTNRKIGVKVTTAAATAVAGTYAVNLHYRAA